MIQQLAGAEHDMTRAAAPAVFTTTEHEYHMDHAWTLIMVRQMTSIHVGGQSLSHLMLTALVVLSTIVLICMVNVQWHWVHGACHACLRQHVGLPELCYSDMEAAMTHGRLATFLLPASSSSLCLSPSFALTRGMSQQPCSMGISSSPYRKHLDMPSTHFTSCAWPHPRQHSASEKQHI